MSAPVRILVIDDEENLRFLLATILGRAGYQVETANNGREGLARLGTADVVLCDVRMPEMDGLAFLAALPDDAPPVVMMSAYGTQDAAIEAMKQGAYDYVSKPFKADEIVLTLRKIEEREKLTTDRARLAVENARLSESIGEPVDGFVGQSASVREVLRVLSRAAQHDTTVLLTGESGTGKEVLARALHKLSARANGPWVPVNCAAIPDALLESELFGHVRGAFTGAVRDHQGMFEQASGGTLFLDEIGDLPLPLQAKLLRAIEEGAIRRIGAGRDLRVDVRIVAATAQALRPPRFREDLYYRLAVVHLQLPPLRERTEDIPLLVDHLLGTVSARMRVARPAVDPEAMRRLVAHPWPGNVRQLLNTLERAVLLCDGHTLRPDDLPSEIGAGRPTEPVPGDLSIPRHTLVLERDLIRRALETTGGNKAAAARLLDISYKALLYKIKDYGLELA